MVVHGEQRFDYSRPLRAGDVVTAEATIESIREAGRNVLMTTRTDVRHGGRRARVHRLLDPGGAGRGPT